MKVIIIILQAILNLVRKRRDLIANRSKIPPEYRDDVVVWYSPKKQRLTNYDVIESYVEDFTNWNYHSNRGSATVTTNKIIITKSFTNIQNIVEDAKLPYEDIKIYVTGISENNPLTINQYVNNKWIRLHTYTTDGIYIIKNRKVAVGFGTYITDDCNITITQLPTSILKDFSGNGLDAYMYGFQGKLNSGVGIYTVDFTIYQGYQYAEHEFAQLTKDSNRCNKDYNNLIKDVESFNVKVDGVINETIIYYYRNEEGIEKQFIINKDGVYTVPKCYMTGINGTSTGFTINNPNENTDITITQIPDYPNQLCYSGKEYCISYNQPILTDYTVIGRRTFFDDENKKVCLLSKAVANGKGAFIVDISENNQNYSVFSFYRQTFIDEVFKRSAIIYQTSNNYNGKIINKGNMPDTDTLWLGTVRDNDNRAFIGCHDDIIILKRSLTINEINDITEAIFNETIIEE